MFNSGTKRCLTVHEMFDLVSYIVIGFVLPAGDAEKLSQALVLERLETSLASVEEEYIYGQRFVYIQITNDKQISRQRKCIFIFGILGKFFMSSSSLA